MLVPATVVPTRKLPKRLLSALIAPRHAATASQLSHAATALRQSPALTAKRTELRIAARLRLILALTASNSCFNAMESEALYSDSK